MWNDLITYPYTNLRGVLFIALFLILFDFGRAAAMRAYHEHGISWPLRGRALTAIWLIVLSGLSLLSVINYLEPFGHDVDLVSAPATAYLGLLVFVSAWTYIRWRRQGLDD